MTRLNENVSEERERELIGKLYDYMGRNAESFEYDIRYSYITCNTDKNGNDYFWYADESNSVAIDMKGNIIDESNSDETLNEILYND